jgi:alkylation response protein AidB-like acyl-CoA dehydrogenase
MDFGFSEEQELLRAEVRKFLDQNASLAEVRKIVETPAGFAPELWRRMAELGWVGLTIPEEHGGVGLGFVDLTVVLEETGRSLFPSPLISTVLAASAIQRAGSAEQRARWLPALAGGSQIGAVALAGRDDRLDADGIGFVGTRAGDAWELSGELPVVFDVGRADLLVTAFRCGGGSESALAVLDAGAPGVERRVHRQLDATRQSGSLRLDRARVEGDALLGAAGSAWPQVARLLDLGAFAVAAEAVGAAEGALALTVAFAKQRVQFGSPIGRFQGVKHPLAEMFVDVESVKSLVYYAAWALDEGAPDAPVAVSRAKAWAAEAFARIGLDAVQLHGGVGYTAEYDAQLYLKRAKWSRPAFGDADHHYDRVAALGGL